VSTFIRRHTSITSNGFSETTLDSLFVFSIWAAAHASGTVRSDRLGYHARAHTVGSQAAATDV